jgi:hypothetical protein
MSEQIPAPNPATPTPEELEQARQMRTMLIVAGVVVALLIIGIIVGGVFLVLPGTPAEFTQKLRDVFIIVMALESLIIGAALVILVVQIASLVNLINNEVRPILESTQETVNTLRGTTAFLGENLIDPIIKLNGYLAGLQRVLELMGIKRK